MKNKKLIIAIIAAFSAGVLWFAFTQEWLIINLPFGRGATSAPITTAISTRKKVAVYLPKQGKLQREEREVLWSENASSNSHYLVAAWLGMLEDELALTKKTSLQTAVIAHEGRELLVSFDRAPVNKNGSTAEKLLLIESLLKSIRSALPSVTTVLFLVDHKAMHDANLDFSRPWPVAGFIDIQAPTETAAPEPITGVFTVMIDPAGDAQKTGRVIGDNFERSITFSCARALKEELEKTVPQVRVLITREPGEISEPYQSATFANRLRANLFISLTCYQEAAGTATCALYHVLYDPVTDLWYKKEARTSWDPYFAAHCANLKATLLAIKTLQDALAPYHQQGLFQLPVYRGIPYRPLVGVQAPAIGCELGISNPDGWRLLIGPLVDGITHVIESLRTKPVSIFGF